MFDYGFGGGEPQACPKGLFLFGVFASEKFVENLALIVGLDADAGIFDRKFYEIAILFDRGENFVAFVAVFDGVVDQVLEHYPYFGLVYLKIGDFLCWPRKYNLNALFESFGGKIGNDILQQF